MIHVGEVNFFYQYWLQDDIIGFIIVKWWSQTLQIIGKHLKQVRYFISKSSWAFEHSNSVKSPPDNHSQSVSGSVGITISCSLWAFPLSVSLTSLHLRSLCFSQTRNCARLLIVATQNMHGHHIYWYDNICETAIREELLCEREPGNTKDRYIL